ncbi:MAG: 3-coathanger stack domain-containing protein, partial [Bacteroidia bacterium]
IHYFEEPDMEKFANGLAYRMIPEPLIFKMNVYGTNYDCDQKCHAHINGTYSNPNPPQDDSDIKTDFHVSGGYPFLSQYNAQIYQQISDFFVPDNVNYFINRDIGITLKAYSQLALYEHLFNPLAAIGGQARNGDPNNLATTWVNSASADLDNDGSDEFLAITAGGNGDIKMYSFVSNTSGDVINYLTSYSPAAFTDIAGGNFDATHGGDEIAVLNTSNVISLLKFSSGNLISFGSNFTPSETIVSLSSGDFNNDGTDEIVALSSGHVFIYQVSSGNLSLLTSFSASGFNKVTVGKYDGGNTNEIAVLNTSGSMAIYNSAGSSLYTAQAPSGTYKSIAAGDYDGDGTSELMVYQSTDATFRVFKVRSGVLSYIPNVRDEEVFPVSQQQSVMCSCHLSSYSYKDALVTFRDYDGQVNVFTMDGHCPNLYLNNQNIDNTNNLGGSTNNYPIDYHSNNILSAGNYIIQSGSKVDFTAGNAVDLKSGFNAKPGSIFHAYISPGLSCSNTNGQNFRGTNTTKRMPARPSSPTAQSSSKPQATDSKTPVSVFPNPTTGALTVSMNNAQAGNYSFSIDGIDGRNLFSENHTLTEGNNDIPLSLGHIANGVYMLKILNNSGSLIKTEKIILQR